MEFSDALTLTVLVPFVAAALALLLGRALGRATGALMVLAAGCSLALSIWVFATGDPASVPEFHVDWITDLDVGFTLRGDTFGLFFAMLVSGIGLLVGVYSCGYIPKLDSARVGRYYAALIAFMGSMLGISLSDDLIALFVFWELTSLTSFLLIGFWYEEDHARKGALTALLVTALGGLAMLAGFVLVGVASGSYSIHSLAHDPITLSRLTNSPLFTAALVLILIGAFSKSAQWPFHFWLPGAMVAPTPVSTYLHAATMVKAGVFLVGRMLPIFGEHPWWSPILLTIGLLTFLWGAYGALVEFDLKAILARTTVSALGMFMVVYGLAAPEQDALQILSHAAYKGSLFLVAGIVEHATHTRDLRELGGLRRKMPITFLLCVIGGLSMAGLYPLLGFHAKEALYESMLHSKALAGWPAGRWLTIAVAVVANACIFAAAFKLIIGVFFGEPTEKGDHAHEAGPALWVPPLVLVGIAAGFGLATHWTSELVERLSSAPEAHVHMSLTPTLGGPLALTGVTIALGIALYLLRRPIERGLPLVAMQRVWDGMMDGVQRGAEAYSRRWQNGSLRWYIAVTLIAFVGLCWFGLSKGGIGLDHVHLSLSEMPLVGAGLCLLLAIAAITVARAKTRIAGSLALTATGYLTALVYVVYRSPDILLTQILIETVATIFILLILFYMPAFKPDHSSPARKLTDLVIAGAVGLTATAFVLLATSPGLRETENLAADYLARSMPDAGGRNAVNVIIVDFRAMDTNGEITVLMVIGLIVFGLLRARRERA